METLQLFDEGRDSSLLDVVCNTVGSGIGVACGALFESWLRRIHTGLQTIRYQQPSSLLLLICLAAYQLSPFFPDYGVYRLQQKLIALTATNEFSVGLCLVSLVEWLAIARLAETAIDPLWVTRLYLALLMLVPAKILIIGHTTNRAELAGAALAYVIWRYGLEHYSRRSQLLAVLFTALIIFRSLSPFQFTSTAMAFSWTPFHALFDTERVAAFTIFFGKLFAFGTLVWLLRDSGWRMRYAAAGAAATLAAIEVAQMFLPDRVPEVADPLLALLLAWIFWLIDDWRYDTTISLPAHAI